MNQLDRCPVVVFCQTSFEINDDTTLNAIVKNYVVGLVLANPASPTGLPEPAPGQEDEAQDLAQEETDKAPMIAIARTIAKAL